VDRNYSAIVNSYGGYWNVWKCSVAAVALNKTTKDVHLMLRGSLGAFSNITPWGTNFDEVAGEMMGLLSH